MNDVRWPGTWKYKVLTVSVDPKQAEHLAQQLDQEGSAGWELVGFLPTLPGALPSTMAVLKKVVAWQ